MFEAALNSVYGIVGSWGWSIIILTLLLKLVLFPSTVKQFRSMNKLREVQPKIKEIQEKYKDRPEEQQKRTMEIYQKEKINPFSSCLPMLIQIPIFLGFYQALQDPTFLEKIKDATFMGITLGADKNLVLAIISGVATFLQQKLTPAASADPAAATQQKMFMIMMPLMLAWFTYQFNAGIGIYWVTNTLLSVIQQLYVNDICAKEKATGENS